MGFAAFASSTFASTTGFTAASMYAWSTTTIDTFSASVLGFVAEFYMPLIAGIMILCIVGFALIVILRAFSL